MYLGKNIHFSPLDNKPLCSYSTKVCKQRRLNGFSLCLRHVLEDPGAPFRQCLYQARNRQQCTNPIHKNNDAQFCTSHLQLLGLLPVGVKSCSKANREGKQVKNGLLNSVSPVQNDQQQNKSKVCDLSTCGLKTEARSASGDPYTFLDVDPPKCSKSSPPLLSMVADVSRIPSCIASVCTTGSEPAVLLESSRSIPISRLYPELVGKLEADGNRFDSSKSKTGRNIRTVSNQPNRTANSRVKLKGSSSPLSALLTNGTGDSSGISSLMRPSVSSSSSSALATDLTPLSNCRTNVTDSRTVVTGSSLCIKNAEMNSRNSWILPVFEPLAVQHSKSQQQQHQSGHPDVQTLSKTLHGLLNTLPLLRSSLQPPFTVGSLPPCSLNYNPSFRSPPEPQKLPEKGFLLNQTPSVTAADAQPPHSLDLKFNGSSASGTFSALPKIKNCMLVSKMTVATSSTPSSTTLLTPEMAAEGVETSANIEKPQKESSLREIHFVRPKSKACCIADKEIKRRIGRKRAWKIYLDHASRVMENTNLLPTGVDSSDDDDDDDDVDHKLPWQRLWNDLSSDESEGDFDLAEDIASNIRRTKLQLLKSKLRRQFTQLRHCHEGNAKVRWRHNVAMDHLVASCREDLSATIDALRSIKNIKSGSSLISCRSNEACRLQKRPCLHQSDSDVVCKSVALPYTNHCIKHIMYNVDQMLFGYCTAKFADKTQCCVPVFDIQHELPLCSDHISTGFGSWENQDQKPKKQRKKTKPSALTRPPKKGKKKKCQRKSSQNPQKMVLGLNDCLNSTDMTVAEELLVDDVQQTVNVTSASPLAVVAPGLCLTSPSATISNTLLTTDALSKDSIDDDALGSDLDVPFSPSGLPLDNDPTSNFLDDHELHEMLNKMADEAFDLSSGKNGGYSSSKEVEEEFVRAFVEVTKTLNNRKETQLNQMSHDHDGLVTLLHDGTHEDELTKQIAESFLNRSTLSPNGSVSDDQDNLGDLASSLTVHDLKSISQAMESSMMNHTLELCPSAIALQSTNEVPSLLSPLYSHKHPLKTTTSNSLLSVDQSLAVPVESHIYTSGILAFPQTSNNGAVENSTSSQLPLRIVTSVSMSPSLPSLLSTMFPLSIGVTCSHSVVSLNSAIVSRALRSACTGDDVLTQPFQMLPDIQTLMRQPWRLGDDPQISEFQPNAVTLSSLAATVGHHGNPFSYLPNFNPSQLLMNESKVGCAPLPKTELVNIESVLTPPTETNAVALETLSRDPSLGACSLSSLQKFLNQKPSAL